MSKMKETLIKTEIKLPEGETSAHSCHSTSDNQTLPQDVPQSVTRELIAARALVGLTQCQRS